MAKSLLNRLSLGAPLKTTPSRHYKRRPNRTRLGKNFKKTFVIFGLSLVLESVALQLITSSQITTPSPTGQVASQQSDRTIAATPTPQPTRLPIFLTAVEAASQPTPTPTPPPPPPFQIPLQNYRTSQYFSRYHTAVDLAATYGSPVYSTNDGTVMATGYLLPGGGLMVQIAHRDGYISYYAHLSRILTQKGATVTHDTQIGKIGTTGWSTGPHLHFMIEQNGRFINPFSIIK